MVDRYKRLATPVAAVLLVALFVVAISLGSSPDSSASGAKVIQWYHDHRTAMNAQSFLFAYSALAGLAYFACVAGYLRGRGAQVLAATTMAGAAIFAAGMLLGAAANTVIIDRVNHINTTTAQTLNIISNDLFAFMFFGGLCAATLSVGVSIIRTRALPLALGIVSAVIGVADATGIVSWPAALLTGPLVLVTAGYVYVRQGSPQEITLPEIPAARSSTETASTKARAKA
jgi:MFS family permease